MTYRLSPGLFVENGAAVLAARVRSARRSGIEHELLRSCCNDTFAPRPTSVAA